MGDWDEDDWENDSFKPVLPAAPKAAAGEFDTAGQALLAKAAEPDASKFEGEDEEEEEEEAPRATTSQPKKKKEDPRESRGAVPLDEPLDDPIAEKLRQQRLVEEADLKSARELFGSAGEDGDTRALDDFLPKSQKDFEEFATLIAQRYLTPHSTSKHYKALAKALVKAAALALSSSETKDLETALAGVRSDKFKAEKEEAKGKGVKGKGTLNLGKSGGAAGLDDYIYDDAADDGYDFM